MIEVDIRPERTGHFPPGQFMDIGIIIGVALLVIWALGALVFEAPGWINFLLTLGVALVIWRIVVRGTPDVGGDTKKR